MAKITAAASGWTATITTPTKKDVEDCNAMAIVITQISAHVQALPQTDPDEGQIDALNALLTATLEHFKDSLPTIQIERTQ